MLDFAKKWIADFVMGCFDTADKMDSDNSVDCDDCKNESTGKATCNCGEMVNPQTGLTLSQEKEIIDNWEPPARFCVITGGKDFWADNVKPDPILGWNLIWNQMIKGEEKTVACTIYDVGVTIIDYESTMTPDTFSHIKQQSYEYMMQVAQEAKVAEDAKKQMSSASKPQDDVNLASYI